MDTVLAKVKLHLHVLWNMIFKTISSSGITVSRSAEPHRNSISKVTAAASAGKQILLSEGYSRN
jgi:hypothetical protein